MSKSRDAFRTISEVAEWLDTPAHVLRFWESKFTQVKPVKRAGGRRYYRPADMQLLAGLKKLLHEDGMTIKGAQKTLREQGVKYVASLSDRPSVDEAGSAPDQSVEDAPYVEMTLAEAEGDTTVIPFERSQEDAEDTVDAVADDTADVQGGSEEEITAAPTEPESATEEPAPAQGSLLDLLGVVETGAASAETSVETMPEDVTPDDIRADLPDEPASEPVEAASDEDVSDDAPESAEIAMDAAEAPTPDAIETDEAAAAETPVVDVPAAPDFDQLPAGNGPLIHIAAALKSRSIDRDGTAELLPKLAHLAGVPSPTHLE